MLVKLNMCIEMDKRLAVFWNSCLLLQSFLAKNAHKKTTCKRVLNVVFVKMKCMRLQIGLPDLKTPKIEILFRVDFTHF